MKDNILIQNNNPMFLSPFKINDIDEFSFLGAYIFSHKDKHLLLNRENGTTILIDDELLNDLKHMCPSDDLQFKLIQRGFAKTYDSLDVRDVTNIILPTYFIIDLTKACNLRCSYCFRHLSNDEPTISDEELDRVCNFIIAYCKKHNQKNISIQPWGGEPLLAFDKIKKIQDKFIDFDIHPQITIESNGTLITPEIAKELYDRKIHIGISIDGIPVVHDNQRKFLNGNDSFSKVCNGILNLREHGYGENIGTISVVTKNSFKYIEDILDYFAKELKLSSVKLNIVRENGSTLNMGLGLDKYELVEFTRRLLKKVIALHKEGYSISEGNIVAKMNNILLRQETNICTSRGCMGGRKMISINRKGKIFPCEMTDYNEESIGTINEDIDLLDTIKEAIVNKDYFTIKFSKHCNKCPWWYYCRGGCTAAIKYINNGEVCGVDEYECLVNRTLYPELIKIILEDPEIAQSLINNNAILS